MCLIGIDIDQCGMPSGKKKAKKLSVCRAGLAYAGGMNRQE
jgi:hypothetical protein